MKLLQTICPFLCISSQIDVFCAWDLHVTFKARVHWVRYHGAYCAANCYFPLGCLRTIRSVITQLKMHQWTQAFSNNVVLNMYSFDSVLLLKQWSFCGSGMPVNLSM